MKLIARLVKDRYEICMYWRQVAWGSGKSNSYAYTIRYTGISSSSTKDLQMKKCSQESVIISV